MIGEFRKALINRGFGVRVEDINAVDAFFGTMPGNGVAQVRRVIAHTRNYVDLMPISAVWAGEKDKPVVSHAAQLAAAPLRGNTGRCALSPQPARLRCWPHTAHWSDGRRQIGEPGVVRLPVVPLPWRPRLCIRQRAFPLCPH